MASVATQRLMILRSLVAQECQARVLPACRAWATCPRNFKLTFVSLFQRSPSPSLLIFPSPFQGILPARPQSLGSSLCAPPSLPSLSPDCWGLLAHSPSFFSERLPFPNLWPASWARPAPSLPWPATLTLSNHHPCLSDKCPIWEGRQLVATHLEGTESWGPGSWE